MIVDSVIWRRLDTPGHDTCRLHRVDDGAPAYSDFGQLVDDDGTVLLCLHQWGAHEHPTLASPDAPDTTFSRR